MKFTDFLAKADAALQQSLGSANFQCINAGLWSRKIGDALNIVWLQKHSSEESFCVNLGIHYTFLPKAGTEAPLGGDVIEFFDCEVKLRLTAQSAEKDQWWPLAFESLNEIANLMRNRGLPIFDSYRLDGPIAEMEARDIEDGNPGLLSSLTKVRACLLLARMHERLGNHNKCMEFVKTGIKLAGMAVGPKKALKDILKRLSHPNV